MINSYSKEFFQNFKYVSDSRMKWREDVMKYVKEKQYPRMQILTRQRCVFDRSAQAAPFLPEYAQSYPPIPYTSHTQFHIGKSGYTITDYHNYQNTENPCILRHDIDYSIERAVKFAKMEKELGAASTYFVLVFYIFSVLNRFHCIFCIKNYFCMFLQHHVIHIGMC